MNHKFFLSPKTAFLLLIVNAQIIFGQVKQVEGGQTSDFWTVYEQNTKTEEYVTPGFTINIPQSTRPIKIIGNEMSIINNWYTPKTRPESPAGSEFDDKNFWTYRDRSVRRMVLAGREGFNVQDIFTAMDYILYRDTWIEKAGKTVAFRQKIRNSGTKEIRLDGLYPLYLKSNDDLVIAGTRTDKWNLLVQPRQKNGTPTGLFLGDFDPLKGFNSGDHASDGYFGDMPTDLIDMDPCGVIQPKDMPGGPTLIFGYISQTGHLARHLLKLKKVAGKTELSSFLSECEMDGVTVPVGGERTSQWIMLRAAEDVEEALADFADRVGVYHGVKKPTAFPVTLNTTWYYYESSNTEKDLKEDLDYIDKIKFPLDVYLMDCGWYPAFGDWDADTTVWPSGLKAAADRIRKSGFIPGIWTCPFLAQKESKLALEHPEWILRYEDGQPVNFEMGRYLYVLDPTYPGVSEFFEELYRKLTNDYGFTYHKFDFMRSVFLERNIKFYDQTKTRLEAYRMGLEAIRRGTGPDAFITMCGGHYGGSLGLVQCQRSGSDSNFEWSYIPVRAKQNLLRTWMSRLWLVNADGMTVRYRENPLRESASLSKSLLSIEEVKSYALNQYLCGGIIKASEKYQEVDPERLAIYRYTIPSPNASCVPLDPFNPLCPNYAVTRITPVCKTLGNWVTVAAINWSDNPMNMQVNLTEQVLKTIPSKKYLVFEFFSQKALGIFKAEDVVQLGNILPHCSRLLKVISWDGRTPVIAGTDLHFTGGGVEVSECSVSENDIVGKIETKWQYPVKVTGAFPSGDSYQLRTVELKPNEKNFKIVK